jgi:hypothetical protein
MDAGHDVGPNSPELWLSIPGSRGARARAAARAEERPHAVLRHFGTGPSVRLSRRCGGDGGVASGDHAGPSAWRRPILTTAPRLVLRPPKTRHTTPRARRRSTRRRSSAVGVRASTWPTECPRRRANGRSLRRRAPGAAARRTLRVCSCCGAGRAGRVAQQIAIACPTTLSEPNATSALSRKAALDASASGGASKLERPQGSSIPRRQRGRGPQVEQIPIGLPSLPRL